MLAASRYLLAVVSSLSLALCAPAFPADFVVTRYDDPTPDGCLATDCSLREAVIDANVALPLDRILLSAGTYDLSIPNVAGDENAAATGDLDVTSSLEIVGAGATMTTIDANLVDRALHFFEILALDNPTLAVRGITFTGGGNAMGSALFLIRNSALIEDCEIRGNGAINGQDAVFAHFGTPTIRRTTIQANTGTGVRALQATVSLENATLSANGGTELFAIQGSIHCRHCTLAGTATAFEVVADGANALVDFSNSIVVGKCLGSNGGATTSLDGNIESPGDTCSFSLGADQAPIDATGLALGLLGDNGGPTPTHLPGASSLASGSAFDTLCLLEDQRGVVRETDCESGAVERTNAVVATLIFADGFQQGHPGAWVVSP